MDISNLNEEITRIVNKAVLAKVAETPDSPILRLEDMSLEQIKEFLRSKHQTTWAIWSISSDDSLDKAARFLANEINLLYTFIYRPSEYSALYQAQTLVRR